MLFSIVNYFNWSICKKYGLCYIKIYVFRYIFCMLVFEVYVGINEVFKMLGYVDFKIIE